MAQNGSLLPTFRGNLLDPTLKGQEIQLFLEWLTLADGAERLSQNLGNKITFEATSNPRRNLEITHNYPLAH
jgi:hypothetical protein